MNQIEHSGPVYNPKSRQFYESLEEAISCILDMSDPECLNCPAFLEACSIVTKHPSLSAGNIIEDLDNAQDFDELPEDDYWSNHISKEDEKELDEFLEKWCQKISTEVWEVTGPNILVDWKAEYKREAGEGEDDEDE